ncbi:MAG: bifunctional UDP-N-acetylglucosamine diphosphorylase/glucosamine-1-phosphate N-acetyltransferase GlmU [Actinomycetota bacterium]|nr:bifunctional UDP-N-acetylglucosamine diphosphorylase/glucosamine-1-phosphate N-acetyltransferase GlmU [Actinomycetota bacterium]
MSAVALILAAGEGTRMKSDIPKVAHRLLGEPMVRLVVQAAAEAGCERAIVVTGHRADIVETLVEDVGFVRQDRQLGTGHAVMCARDALADFGGSLVVLSGDTPLLRPETIRALVDERESTGAAVAVLTTRMSEPTGYGRIVRCPDGTVERIVEQKDASAAQLAIDEINTGTYCFDSRALFEHLERLDTDNAQGEYYLTDMVAIFAAENLGVAAVMTEDPMETMGVNSRVQLAEASGVLQRRINERHMLAGVTMTDPGLVWIGPRVELGRDIVIEPMTFLMGDTRIGDRVVLGPGTRITDSFIAEDATVDSSVVTGASVGPAATVGPVAYLRPGTVLGARAKAGTAVEIKNSTVGEGSKVPHLSYIGDATIGKEVNVGAGTITCNYDGVRKHKTVIGDGAFIGSDTMLVAPVRIGRGAVTGAASAITRDVPDDALGVERSEQRTIEDWLERKSGSSTGEND